jgi:protein O-mannosyl-transferase
MRREVLICLFLAGITLGIYRPVGHLGFFYYDDPDYILTNPPVLGGITGESVWWAFTTNHARNWHPVTWLSHILDCQLFGLNPSAFHWENLAFHIANTLLLFIVLRKMTRAIWRSALVASLFAWHPMHIQSVAWISERKDVLSGFFMLLTLWAYTRYAQESEVRSRKLEIWAPASGLYWLTLIFFALGLMSKPMLVTLPAILLLLDFWPLNRMLNANHSVQSGMGIQFSTLKSLFLEKIPFIALSLASVMATFWAQYIIKTDWLPVPVRIANVPAFYTVYLEKLFWPENLSVFYPYRLIPFWEQSCSFLLLILLTVICFRRMRSQPYCLVGWLWFLIMLLPVIGLVQVGEQSIADRYTYLPSIGIFVIVVWGIGEMAAIFSCWLTTGITIGAAVLILACLLLDTRFQLKYWRDSITLFRHSLDVTKENNSSSYFGLGCALLYDAGDWDGAATNFKAALQTGSTYPSILNFAAAHHNLGLVLLQQNKPVEAEVHFEAALRTDPKNSLTHKFLGDALSDQGKTAEAEIEYSTAMQLMPGNTVLFEKIEASKTLAKLCEVLKTEPTPEIHVEIAEIQASQGKFQDAVEHYIAALKLQPDSPEIQNNLAWLFATCPNKKIRDGNLAVKYSQQACELTQFKKTIFIGTLAAAYAEAEKFDDAIATAQRACDLATKNGETDLLQKNQELLERYRAHEKVE